MPSTYRNLLPLFPKYATSDHARQALKVEEFERPESAIPEAALVPLISISGSTWNMMNFGVSNAHHPEPRKRIANNPFREDESNYGYVKRKQLQLAEILEQISVIDDSNPKFSQVDFMLLQEADVFTNTLNIFKNLPEPFKSNFSSIINKFQHDISKIGWKLLLPNKGLGVKYGLATLYNTNVLSYDSEEGLFRSTNTQASFNHGYEVSFTHIKTTRKLAIANIHLERDRNYIQDILDHQYTKRSLNILSIMGGDTNHVQNIQQIGLIGARDYSTQFGGTVSSADQSLRTRDRAQIGMIFEFPKRFDGFFVAPSKDNTRIRATELKGMYFKKSMNTQKIYADFLNPAVTYIESSERKGIFCDQAHVHNNGYFLNLAFGWPCIPNRLKLFFKNLEKEGILIKTEYGAPDYHECMTAYPTIFEQSVKDYKDINETYRMALKIEKAKDHGVIEPISLLFNHKQLLSIRVNKDYDDSLDFLEKQKPDFKKIKQAEKNEQKKQKKILAKEKILDDLKKNEADGFTVSRGKKRH